MPLLRVLVTCIPQTGHLAPLLPFAADVRRAKRRRGSGERRRHGGAGRGTRVDVPKLLHVPDGRGGEHLRDAIRRTLFELPPPGRRTLVWDQGSEMAGKLGVDTPLVASVPPLDERQ